MAETGVELQQLIDEEKLSHVPLLIMANKQDLVSALGADEVAELLNLQDLRDRTWQILPCSAVSGDGLQESMEWIVEQINTSCGKKAKEAQIDSAADKSAISTNDSPASAVTSSSIAGQTSSKGANVSSKSSKGTTGGVAASEKAAVTTGTVTTAVTASG